MKKIISIFCLLSMVFLLINAQSKKPFASFSKEVHDFGKIKEADGTVSYQFVFTNIGAEPLLIKNVVSSCGCTTPNYPKEPVLPGAKASITVTYNPAGRPGRFDKSITLYTNGDPETQVLRIVGDVIPKEPSIEDQFPNDIEGLRLKSLQIAFNNVTPNEKPTQTVEVYNATNSPLKVSFIDVPKFLQVKISPDIIPPKSKAMISVTYDVAAKNDWGFVFDRFGIMINNNRMPSKLAVSANIQEDFSKLSETEKNNAPRIVVENPNYDFGTIKQGEKATYDFVIKNMGKRDLIIRKTSASCGCTVANLKSQTIKPGESTVLSAEFNSSGRTGNQQKTITLITNDPVNQRVILWMKGNIVQ